MTSRFPLLRLDPLTRTKMRRFRLIRRGYASFLILVTAMLLSCAAEVLVHSRALVVRYEGNWYFPTYGRIHTGKEFGLDYAYEVNYRDLRTRFNADAAGRNWVLLPPVPYNPLENCYVGENFRPRPPDWRTSHFLGTDQINRDILARLVYGFRNALVFAGSFILLTYAVGITLGCLMGYFGGWFDLFVQRLIEIWSNIPFLFVVIIVASIVPSSIGMNLGVLLFIVVLFSWTGMTYYMRSATYREKARDYVHAAQVLGAGTSRIIFRHILPNVLSTIVTFIPFTIASSISALTALDFLGFGLPPPTPSWGELLRQGTSNLHSPWIVASAFSALVIVLVLVTFVGEAIREAFDPKKFTTYQ
ncbi:MAG: ABC transporter permease subunit [Verrucomicrobia bacterium]|nr:ABC transporter permease subunit [Verrucomicrobiota bacterium]